MNGNRAVTRDWAEIKSADECQAENHDLLARPVTENFSAAGVWAGASERVMSFGRFRLLPMQRLLLEGDRPVRFGSRAFDLLLALVERRGELVSKTVLTGCIWPDTLVEEDNLKVHISALRRALADGKCGNRYVANIPGRGYRFIAPVTVQSHPKWSLAAEPNGRHNLPARLTRLVGRADSMAMLATSPSQQRLLTIVGTGGIGKTSVALAVADGLTTNYEHDVWLVDAALVDDPNLLLTTLAAALGIAVEAATLMTCLIRFLRDKQLLLVLDNCEHVVGATAALAVSILNGAPGKRHRVPTSFRALTARESVKRQ